STADRCRRLGKKGALQRLRWCSLTQRRQLLLLQFTTLGGGDDAGHHSQKDRSVASARDGKKLMTYGSLQVTAAARAAQNVEQCKRDADSRRDQEEASRSRGLDRQGNGAPGERQDQRERLEHPEIGSVADDNRLNLRESKPLIVL